MFLLALAGAGVLFGALLRRWWAMLIVLLVPLYFAGLRASWWGSGVGDFWELAAIGSTLVALASVTVGVSIGRALASRRKNPAKSLHGGSPS